MPDAALFQIELGNWALSIVDKTEPGYQDSWQAPGGATVDTATMAIYDPNAQTWRCQVTGATLTPSPSTTTTDVPATFCAPAKTIPTPAETSYNLDTEFIQDPQVMAGISRYLYEHDTEEAYFYLGLDLDNPPKAIGRLRVQAGAIGGDARTTLVATVSLPCSRKPQIAFGDVNASEAVPPNPTPLATGATSGVPGTWTPAGSTAPADAAEANAASITASPLTAWLTGEYVVGTAAQMHWDSTTWVTGQAP